MREVFALQKLLHCKSFSHFFNKKYWQISDIYVEILTKSYKLTVLLVLNNWALPDKMDLDLCDCLQMVNLDLWDCFGREISSVITKEIQYPHVYLQIP